MKTIGIIPARYGSTRLPGKPLKDICGRPMIWWVYERCKKSNKLNAVYVATDDQRIVDACDFYKIPCLMTQSTHRTAANRLFEVSKKIDGDFYIQINGDEPLIDVTYIDEAIPEHIPLDYEYGTNIVCPIRDENQLNDISNIKVVFDNDGFIKYMSRNVIPYSYHDDKVIYYKHVGIIGYNKKMLDFYSESTPGVLELSEGIDTLRFIDYGKKLQAIKVEKYDSLSVDTEHDLEYVRNYMERMNG